MQIQTTEANQFNPVVIQYFQTAKRLNLPPDALINFRNGGYLAQFKQIEFHAAARQCDKKGGPTQVGFGGARGPGKSHALFAQIALDDCQRFEGLKVLYLRKVAKNAREQFDDLRRSVLKFTPHEYKRHEGVVVFQNDSRIIIGHFKNESDIDQYLGLEYDIICIEEATTLTESKYKTLRDSNRTSKEGFRPRIYCSTNPGGVGHSWFKKRFIVPARNNQEEDTRFVFATVDDNAFVDEDYTKKLEENTGWKLKAYRYGDWDIAAGQFFTNWRHDAVVTVNMGSPQPWQTVWAAMDYGYTHPTVVYLFGYYDGKIQVFDEYRACKQPPDENAREILRMFRRHGVEIWRLETFVAGRDVFAQKADANAKTVYDQYLENGIELSMANDDRINGWAEVLKLLGDVDRKPNPKEPMIEISDRCVNLINCIPSLEHNPNRPEDVLKKNANEEGEDGDDEGDTLRYGVMATYQFTGGSYESGVPG